MAAPSPETSFGATAANEGVTFSVWSGSAARIDLCLFDGDGGGESRHPMQRDADGTFSVTMPGLTTGQKYGYRADGPHDPSAGLWFDPAKLLIDPWTQELDRPPGFDPRLAAPRTAGTDTAPLMPKSVVTAHPEVPPAPPLFRPGGLIYEINTRSFTMLHPEVPPEKRGTVAALAEPAILAHLTGLGVSAVELMPITAWIDERHLTPLGLRNAWGYNPVNYMAPDPRICPGGMAELAATVSALHAAGIGVILDVVFNHTGESDILGPTLSLRGLDATAYFRHDDAGGLINDTGCGNTLNCEHPATRRLVLDSMRAMVRLAGVDGFRFDLAPILGRTSSGFDPEAPLLQEICTDAVLADRILIAEPWDIGPGGYNLGGFPGRFLEWNDRFRDTIRRFWRGDTHMAGALATAMAGSSDTFGGTATRSVNFTAAHDGFTLADLVSYEHRHNLANGEENRDGHSANHSWNNGAEGATTDPGILAARSTDIRALLACLFLSRGAIMLTAGDECGRSQDGNNNAYAQDNEIAWLDWQNRDIELEAFCCDLSALRRSHSQISGPGYLTGNAPDGLPDVEWLRADGGTMQPTDWEAADQNTLAMVLHLSDESRLAVLINSGREEAVFDLPQRPGWTWGHQTGDSISAAARAITTYREEPRQ